MKKIIILGAGMVGRAIAIDLSEKYQVTSVDLDKKALDFFKSKPNIKTTILDVTNQAAMAAVIEDFDLVISAVPGFLGLQTMIQVIKLKKDLVDISFLPEDVQYLDSLAKENNVTVVMDCGIAPGMPNYIIGYHNERMILEEVMCMVGALPKVRKFPFEYKAPFSPVDVIEEYTRPARYVEQGLTIVKPALSDAEFINFDRVGTLEAFNTDGLRSLIFTMKHIPSMKEKTLRYPGHINYIKALKESGFFSREPIIIEGVPVMPFDFTSKVLFNSWKSDVDEPEFTVMKITLMGFEKGVRKQIVYDLYDESDTKERISSMGRTTGFTATATAELLLSNLFNEKGLFPPELVGKNPVCFDFILNYLSDRDVQFVITEKDL